MFALHDSMKAQAISVQGDGREAYRS
jgi:hypothetical protein